MQQDDRFSMIVVIAVTVVVAVVFFAVHGLPVVEPEVSPAPREVRERIDVTPVPHGPTAVQRSDDSAQSNEWESGPAPGAVQAAVTAGGGLADDGVVRAAVRGVVAHPELARWLAPDRLVYRFVRLVDAVAQGSVPKEDLAVFGPWQEVLVRRADEQRLVLAAGTYRRYGSIVETLAAAKPKDLVALYRRLEPACDAVYERLGTGGGAFEDRLRAAVIHMLGAPVPNRNVEVEQRSLRYAFADHDLEALSDAQKHVVLMGRDNARLFQASLRSLAREFGWTVSDPPSGLLRVADDGDGLTGAAPFETASLTDGLQADMEDAAVASIPAP